VGARRRHQRRETPQELEWLKLQHLAAVGERALEALRETAVGQRGEAIWRQRRTRAVTAQVQRALAVVGMEVNAGVEREAS